MGEHEDYSVIFGYESNGKEYSGEKAIISMTSWKRRISTCAKTIYSLLKHCPGFHIVLVLSKDEFPQKENELPRDLMLLVENKLIELFWIKPNLRSFKKVLFTLDKYRTVPIISADDGQIYIENFAERLYRKWSRFPKCICSITHLKYHSIHYGVGCRGIIYPPYCFQDNGIKLLNDTVISSNNDDFFIGIIAKIFNINYKFLNSLNYKRNNFVVIDSAEKVGITLNKKCCDSILLRLFKKYIK